MLMSEDNGPIHHEASDNTPYVNQYSKEVASHRAQIQLALSKSLGSMETGRGEQT